MYTQSLSHQCVVLGAASGLERLHTYNYICRERICTNVDIPHHRVGKDYIPKWFAKDTITTLYLAWLGTISHSLALLVCAVNTTCIEIRTVKKHSMNSWHSRFAPMQVPICLRPHLLTWCFFGRFAQCRTDMGNNITVFRGLCMPPMGTKEWPSKSHPVRDTYCSQWLTSTTHQLVW